MANKKPPLRFRFYLVICIALATRHTLVLFPYGPWHAIAAASFAFMAGMLLAILLND